MPRRETPLEHRQRKIEGRRQAAEKAGYGTNVSGFMKNNAARLIRDTVKSGQKVIYDKPKKNGK